MLMRRGKDNGKVRQDRQSLICRDHGCACPALAGSWERESDFAYPSDGAPRSRAMCFIASKGWRMAILGPA
jgi:hypothetical protein